MSGAVVDGDDSEYDEARKLWNAAIDGHPAIIARCASPADVTAAIQYARQHGPEIAVRVAPTACRRRGSAPLQRPVTPRDLRPSPAWTASCTWSARPRRFSDCSIPTGPDVVLRADPGAWRVPCCSDSVRAKGLFLESGSMKDRSAALPDFDERSAVLERARNKKMARSPHAFVRGNTVQFYDWLASMEGNRLPHGPPVWIGGDCHVGNLGPVAGAGGRVRIQIRDLDHTVMGNPAHDLIRLALSLASTARGCGLPGVTTVRMLEAIMDGYESAFDHDFDEADDDVHQPKSVQLVMKRALKRTWKQLAKERIKDTQPTIPLGKRFWPLSEEEQQAIERLFRDEAIERLVTMVRSRDDDAKVEVIDAAYWKRGCGSLGRVRYAVLVGVTDSQSGDTDHCLMDIRGVVDAAAPAHADAPKLEDNAKRVVEGARHISPVLGERMRATRLGDQPVFIRELLPEDLKVEIDHLTTKQAMKAARFLATVVGFAHARQMDSPARAAWRDELGLNRSKTLDAPSWLWSSVVELLARHERGYLEHCRRYAMATVSAYV